MGSKRFWLDGTDFKKLGIGALVALGGALVTVVAEQVIPAIDQGTAAGALIGSFATIGLNFARKFLSDYSRT